MRKCNYDDFSHDYDDFSHDYDNFSHDYDDFSHDYDHFSHDYEIRGTQKKNRHSNVFRYAYEKKTVVVWDIPSSNQFIKMD